MLAKMSTITIVVEQKLVIFGVRNNRGMGQNIFGVGNR